VPDPPVGEAVKVAGWPLSTVDGGTETVRAVLTVTVAAGVVTVTGVEDRSVIWISNDQVPVIDRICVPDMGPGVQGNGLPKSLKVDAPGAFSSD
jgi:hypothetical protein